ncbi:hypothetical protein [Pseudomonas sp. 22 E 5]|nr:hypothetical protein [Pseudomonas sp. 22 E 5]
MLEEFLPAVPRGQAAKCVPAQKQKQLVIRGQLGAHQFQGVNSVGRFIALELAVVHHQRRYAVHRQAHHFQALLR